MKKTVIILSVLVLIAGSCEHAAKKQAENKLHTHAERDTIEKNKDISDPTNTLNGNTETLTLQYVVWGCTCANWITLADFEKFQNSALAEHCIFIEPASKDLELPSDFDPFEHFIQVTGQFYVKPDYPKGTIQEEEHLDKARVFCFTEIEIIKNK